MIMLSRDTRVHVAVIVRTLLSSGVRKRHCVVHRMRLFSCTIYPFFLFVKTVFSNMVLEGSSG